MSVLKRIASLFRRKVTKSVSSAESSTKKARQQQAKIKTSRSTPKFLPMQFSFLADAWSKIRGIGNSTWSIPGLDASERPLGQSFWKPTPPGRRAMRRKRGQLKGLGTPSVSTTSVRQEVHKPWNNPKEHRHQPSCHQSWMMDDEIDQQRAAAIDEMQDDKAE